ncbi:MAG: hypothetical protein JNL93_17815 [Pelomonas sp.]|nr:hypothetical protein [Roseateles sp.]
MQPAAQKAELSTRASFAVTADAATGYQWQRDSGSGWQDIAGATSASYTTGFLLAGDDGAKFRVTVSNAAGSLASDAASLSVTAPVLELKLLAGSIAGPGYEDGALSDAKFDSPMAIARDVSGNLYVSDSSAVRKITPAGVVSTLAGKPGVSGHVDGAGPQARFGLIRSMAVDGQGNVYVGESNDGYFIRKVTPAGVVSSLAGMRLNAGGHSTGQIDGVGAAASFNTLEQMAADRAGNLYVADFNRLRKVQPDGTVTTVQSLTCGSCFSGPAGFDTNLFFPSGIVIDGADNIWVMDRGVLRKITPAGVVFDVAGDGVWWRSPDGNTALLDGQGIAASFGIEHGRLALASNGNLLVAQTPSYQKSVIRTVTPSGLVTTIAGQGSAPGAHDGPGAQATFGFVFGLAADSSGGAYIPDRDNSAIRYVSSAGVVSTLAGMAEARDQGSADGKGAAARFKLPGALAVDGAGNAVVSDCGNATLRKITRDGAVTTVAGTAGQPGQVDGKGSASQIQCASALVFGNDGTLFFNGASPGADIALRRMALDGTVGTWTVRQSVLAQPVVSGLAVHGSGDVLAAVNQPGTVGNSFILRLTANGTSEVFSSYAVPPELTGWGFAALSGNGQGQWIATEYGPAAFVNVPLELSAISAAGVRKPLDARAIANTIAERTVAAAVLDARGDVYVMNGTGLWKIAADGTVATVIANLDVLTTRLGTAPRLRNVRGMAVWGPNQLLVTAENAVLVLTVPGVACDCKGR